MDQENFNAISQKGYFHTTFVDPIAVMILAAMCLMILFTSRKYATWPMFVIACFITQAQRFSLGSADFTFVRIITCFAIVRVIMRGEYRGFKWNGVDRAVLFFQGVRTVYAFLHITKNANVTPLTLCGESLDTYGQYFFFRFVVRDFDEMKCAIYGFIFIAIPNSVGFLYERISLHNPFFFMGGVSDLTRSRQGVLRCMNAYSHPILAGCFWAALLPYMGAVIKQNGRIKMLPLFGIVAASIIIILSGSSTPIAGAGLAFLGGCAYLIRRRLKMLRWTFFFLVLAAQLMANSPVWKVFARVQIIGGSTGYYRFKLIDQFIHHFPQWFLAGSATGTTMWDVPMFDIVNYYVVLGLSGGLVFVFLVIWVLVEAFRRAGVGVRSAGGDSEKALMAWSTGVSIFVHMMTFLAVTYYGQITVVWYFSLALTSVSNRNAVRQGFSVLTGWNADPLSRLAARRVSPYRQPARLRYGV